jgi:DNA-binding PucR family transcriptional regulator
MGFVSVLEPAQRVPTITDLVNRSNRFVDLVADQLTMAYEQEHDRWVSRRGGLEQRWVSQVLAGPVDVKRAEKAMRYRLDGLHLAAVLWVDAAVATSDVVALFDQARSLVAAELGAVGRSLMVPTDERGLGCGFRSGPLARGPGGRTGVRACARRSREQGSGRAWHAVVRKTGCTGSGHR